MTIDKHVPKWYGETMTIQEFFQAIDHLNLRQKPFRHSQTGALRTEDGECPVCFLYNCKMGRIGFTRFYLNANEAGSRMGLNPEDIGKLISAADRRNTPQSDIRSVLLRFTL